MQETFAAVWKYCEKGFGVDIGCGSNRLSPDILTIDVHDEGLNGGDLIMDSALLDWRPRGGMAGFRDHCFDFIFSSHCLEDFDDIGGVLNEWWRKIKVAGYLVLLLPDMEGGRYPKVGEEGGNSSHRTNVGVEYMKSLTSRLFGDGCEIVQCDTVTADATFDFVARRRR